MSFPCKCGHAESLHTRSAGPNSIGQYWHGMCMQGWDTVGGYYVFDNPQSCHCAKYRSSAWQYLRIRMRAAA